MLYTVYKTTNKVNGKIYVGQHSTENLNDGYLGSGVIFKKELKKHGRLNFEKEILFQSGNDSFLNEIETYYIHKYKSFDPTIGYNILMYGDTSRGYVCSEETKKTTEKRIVNFHM